MPKPSAPASIHIRPWLGHCRQVIRSGTGTIQIDYEGNLYDAENLRNYLEKLFHAVARHVTGHPTVARKYRPTGENSPFIIVDTLNYRETVKGNHSKVVSSSE